MRERRGQGYVGGVDDGRRGRRGHCVHMHLGRGGKERKGTGWLGGRSVCWSALGLCWDAEEGLLRPHAPGGKGGGRGMPDLAMSATLASTHDVPRMLYMSLMPPTPLHSNRRPKSICNVGHLRCPPFHKTSHFTPLPPHLVQQRSPVVVHVRLLAIGQLVKGEQVLAHTRPLHMLEKCEQGACGVI